MGKRHPNQIYIGNGLIHRENGTKVKDYGYPQLQALKARLLLNTNECIELLAISDLARANLATLMVYLQETFANEEKELHVDWQMKQVYVTNKEGKRIRKYALCASIRK